MTELESEMGILATVGYKPVTMTFYAGQLPAKSPYGQ